MKDLLSFLLILLVFVIAFGVAMQITLYPNTQLEVGLMRDVVRKSYWRIYGELFLDELEGICDSFQYKDRFKL